MFRLDHEERTLALAALTLRRLKDIEGSTEVEHVTWVQEDAGRSHELLETIVRWKDFSWSGGSIPSGRLRLVLQEFLAKYTVRTVKEVEDESGKVGLVLSSEDINRVRFFNGRSYNDDSVFEYGSGNRGFTITKKSGEEVEYHVPAYAERVVYRLEYEQRQLAMMALLLEKLDELSPDQVIISAHAPAPNTEYTSTLENVLYAPLGPAPDGGYHIPVKGLKRVFQSFLDTLTVTDNDSMENGDGTHILELTESALGRINFQECNIDPWTDYEVRGSTTLGFTVTLKDGVIKRFTPRSSGARSSVFNDRFEDRPPAILALIADLAEERNIPGEIDIDFKAFEVYAGLVSKVMDEVKGKNRDGLRKTLAHHWNIIDKKDRPTSQVVIYDKDLESVSFRNFSTPRPFYGFGIHSQEDLGFTIGSRMFTIKGEEASEDVYYGPLEDRFDALLVLAHEKAKADGVQYPISVVVASKSEVMNSELLSDVNNFIREKDQDDVDQYLRKTWEVVRIEA